MDNEPNSFYPPDFPVELANVVTGCHTLDAVRIAKKNKIVARLNLKVGDDATPHGKQPDMNCEEIAADLWGRIETDAQKNCKGYARYKIIATYSKPKQGPAPEPQSFEIECGDPPLRTGDEAHRDNLVVEMNSLLQARHKEQIELLRETTKLAEAVGKMATGLASAWSSVHEKAREDKEHTLELAVLASEREGERERMRLFEKSLVPMLKVLQGKRGGVIDATVADDRAEIIRIARKLGGSFTGEQLEHAAKILGADRLREFATIEEEPELLALVGWLAGLDEMRVLDVYGKLRDDQVAMVDKIQTWAADEGDKHAASKAAS